MLLREAGFVTSPSAVGGILARLKERRLLREPPCNGISARKRHRKRPYAVRKPQEYVTHAPDGIDAQMDAIFRSVNAKLEEMETSRESIGHMRMD